MKAKRGGARGKNAREKKIAASACPARPFRKNTAWDLIAGLSETESTHSAIVAVVCRLTELLHSVPCTQALTPGEPALEREMYREPTASPYASEPRPTR